MNARPDVTDVRVVSREQAVAQEIHGTLMSKNPPRLDGLLADPQRPVEERHARFEALRAYCRRDAWGMVALHDWLLEHVAT